MKKTYLLLLFLAFVSHPLRSSFAGVYTHISQRKDVIVYITRTGEKYHRDNCRYLRQSKISISKKEATRQRYTACKVCTP